MIAFLQSLPVGNAVRCLLDPEAGASTTRVLRKTTDDIAGEADPAAAVVYEGVGRYFVDTAALQNGELYHYRAFDKVGLAWIASPSAAVTVEATAEMDGPDVLALTRKRLHEGLKVEVTAGRLVHETGAIPVLTAPPQFDGTKWPVVSVHFTSAAPEVRALGEEIAEEIFDEDADEWVESEGWHKRHQLTIVGFSLNPDERNALRVAVEKVVLGNLQVFNEAGMSEISFTQSDVDDMETYGTPVFSTINNLSFLAPATVTARSAPISDVTVEAQLAA